MSLPPDPRANPELIGHDGAALTLAEAAQSGRMHHAWLLAGADGVGKATLAYRFAKWLLAGRPFPITGQPPLALDPDHPVARRVGAGAHADLFTVAPNTGERGIKEVLRAPDARAAVRFLAHTAAEGGWRVVVMEDAEQVDNPAVHNILLKTLEEPPPRAVLLLVSAQPDWLLPTIRSRCRRLDLAPLAEPELAGLLARWLPELSAEQRGLLAGIADGSPGRALELASGEGLAMQGLVDRTLGALPSLGVREAHAIAEGVTARRDANALTTFMTLLRRALAAATRDAARGRPAAGWIGSRSLADWAVLWDKLGRLADETERLNLDRKQTVLTGLSWIAVR